MIKKIREFYSKEWKAVYVKETGKILYCDDNPIIIGSWYNNNKQKYVVRIAVKNVDPNTVLWFKIKRLLSCRI